MGSAAVVRMDVDFAILQKTVNHVGMAFMVPSMVAVCLSAPLMVNIRTTFLTKMADVASGRIPIPTVSSNQRGKFAE